MIRGDKWVEHAGVRRNSGVVLPGSYQIDQRGLSLLPGIYKRVNGRSYGNRIRGESEGVGSH